ncbi:MAG: AAA family ATPase, partial [Prevotella sp.]|nr:AAA family ATPase [Prevotella sp.]
YVDKTDLVWQMANENNPFLFLARPRRFGKSLLASTLHSFFAGERELFRGLKVEQLEWDWKSYPVLHFDLSGTKHLPPQMVEEELSRQLKKMEQVYGDDIDETSHREFLTKMYNRPLPSRIFIVTERCRPRERLCQRLLLPHPLVSKPR